MCPATPPHGFEPILYLLLGLGALFLVVSFTLSMVTHFILLRTRTEAKAKAAPTE